MWITIAALIFGLVGCFWGIRRGVLAAWVCMFNVMISVYLGIMTVTIIGKYSPNTLPNQWAKVGVLFLTAALLLVILEILNVHLFSDYPAPALPKYFEKIGSGLFGFISGYIVLWFLVYTFFITPVGNSYLKSCDEKQANLLLCSRCKVDMICNVLELLSLQEDDGQAGKIYSWLENTEENAELKKQDIVSEDISAQTKKGDWSSQSP
ncbi:MAG: CvpA family protein [Sedimentisphaeraceae bacterium JB056]